MLAVRRPACAATTALIRNATAGRAEATLASRLETAGPSKEVQAAQDLSIYDQLRPGSLGGPRRTFSIRTWDESPSMQEGLAIVRAFEARFGKLRDIRFGRDFEVSEVYQPMILATFEDDSNYNQIPESESNIQLEIPVFHSSTPGDVQLVDLQGLLHPYDKGHAAPEDLWANVSFPNDKREVRVVEIRTGRYSQPVTLQQFIHPPERRPSEEKINEIGVEFSRWGGFFKPQTTAPQVEHELQPGEAIQSNVDVALAPDNNSRMQWALRRWEGHVAARRVEDSLMQDQTQTTKEAEAEAEADELDLDEFELRPTAADERARSVTEAAATETAEIVEAVSAEPTVETQPSPAKLTKREKLLALARAHAANQATTHTSSSTINDPEAASRERERQAAFAHTHTPLPEDVVPRDPEEEKRLRAEEKAKKEAQAQEVKTTVLGRLRKLWGGL